MSDKTDAPDADPTALKRLVDKFSTKLSDGTMPKGIQRRKATVVIDPELCEPDTFDGPVVIGLEGINAAAELDALKGASDGASAGYAMARKAMRTINGQPMKKHEADLVWEALGFSGRALVMSTFLEKCTGASGAALGKSLGITEET